MAQLSRHTRSTAEVSSSRDHGLARRLCGDWGEKVSAPLNSLYKRAYVKVLAHRVDTRQDPGLLSASSAVCRSALADEHTPSLYDDVIPLKSMTCPLQKEPELRTPPLRFGLIR